MELLDNYNKAVKELLSHIGFKYGGEWLIVDCSMMYWHLIDGKVLYSPDNDVDDNPFNSLLINKRGYDSRVFSGTKLTGIITGKLGSEVLQIFDNHKYTGNVKKEKKYL
jgi:hypothetical protein